MYENEAELLYIIYSSTELDIKHQEQSWCNIINVFLKGGCDLKIIEICILVKYYKNDTLKYIIFVFYVKFQKSLSNYTFL